MDDVPSPKYHCERKALEESMAAVSSIGAIPLWLVKHTC